MLIRGTVISGRGEGRFYLTTKGYVTQVKHKLGFSPYPGTLNIQVANEDIPGFQRLKACVSRKLTGFTAENHDFGDVLFYRCRIARNEPCALVIPKITHHDNVMELIAPGNLRESLGLRDGDMVAVSVLTTDVEDIS